jgi:ABC-type sugar transport system substrate-binding protein
MKKYLLFFTSVMLVATLIMTACAPKAPEVPTGEELVDAEPAGEKPENGEPSDSSAPAETTVSTGGKPLIGLTVPSMISLYDLTGQALKAKFPDYDVQVVSADDSVSNQVQQIQNFTTMGAKMIVVAPTEIEAIEDALLAAREVGIKVVISGATAEISEDAYDAVTGSDEYLIGTYVALLAKKWAEEKLEGQQFDTIMLSFTANYDAIARSNGVKSIIEPDLKNRDGQYVNFNGQIVDEAEKVENPAYSELVANAGGFYEYEVGPGGDALATAATAFLEHPNARLVLCYMSLNATAVSQYIVDNIPEADWDGYGVFGGGVVGDESSYLIGSVSDTEGTRSVFRGAVSFGGDNVADGIADLAASVMSGVEGVDYQKLTPSAIGVWFTREAEFTFPAKVSSFSIANQPTVLDFNIIEKLNDPTTTSQWQEGDEAPGAEGHAGGPSNEKISMGESVDAAAITGKEFTFIEEVPQFNLKIPFILVLNADGSYTITEENPDMGQKVYQGSTFTYDGTYILTGPIEEGGKPIAGWFEADGSCSWKLEGETLTPVNY